MLTDSYLHNMSKALEILITQKQFDDIIELLNPTWIDTLINTFFFPVMVGLTTVLCSYYFQIHFQKRMERKDRIREVQNFNEALIYTSVFLENIVSTINEVVLPTYKNENVTSFKLSKESTSSPHLKNMDIPPFENLSENRLLSKISNKTEFIEFMQVYYRTEHQVRQFNALCEHRSFLNKKLHSENGQEQLATYIIDRYSEIHDSTVKMLYCAESILDGILFLTLEFQKIGNDLKVEVKKEKLTNLDVCMLEKNALHFKLLEELNSIFDSIPHYKNRLLHIPKN